MAATIKIKNSSTASAVPTSSDLVQGELAVNVTDKRLFTENASGTVVELGTNPSTLTVAAGATIQGLTVGRGAGAVSTNTAVGASALAANTTGANNTAVGYQSANASTTVDNITAIGYQALLNNTAAYNTAVGRSALASNTSGGENVAVGGATAFANTTGAGGTAVGYTALRFNTTGGSNTAIGNAALFNNTTASNNTAVGYQARYAGTTGANNTALGRSAMESATTGSGNTFIGYVAGSQVTTGSNNTILGSYNGNQGSLDIRTSNNYIVLSDGDGNPRMYFNASGNPFIPSIRAAAGTYTAKITAGSAELTFDTSSARYKDNIRDSSYGLDAVMALRSAMFEYKSDPNRTDVGLIAEEVFEVIPELVAVNANGEKDAVNYDRFVSVCIKAIQELKAEFDAYKEAHP